MSENFCHIHCHTEWSILDGTGLLTKIVSAAKEKGFTAQAITDHGTVSGILQFHNLCRKSEVKPILGCEFYFVDDAAIKPKNKEDTAKLLIQYDKEDHKAVKEKIKIENNVKKIRDHIVILVKDATGYENLMKLVAESFSIGAIEGGFGRVIGRIDWRMLEEYHEGLIATTACTSGIIARPLLQSINSVEGVQKNAPEDFGGRSGLTLANYRAERLKRIFGEDLYIEIMPINMEDQRKLNPLLCYIAKNHNIQLVASNDCHYIESEDSEVQDVLLCIQRRQVLSDPDRWRFDARDLFLRTRKEMESAFKTNHKDLSQNIIAKALDNTMVIADKCNFTFPHCEPRLPNLDIKQDSSYAKFESWKATPGILHLMEGLDELALKAIAEKELEE